MLYISYEMMEVWEVKLLLMLLVSKFSYREKILEFKENFLGLLYPSPDLQGNKKLFHVVWRVNMSFLF